MMVNEISEKKGDTGLGACVCVRAEERKIHSEKQKKGERVQPAAENKKKTNKRQKERGKLVFGFEYVMKSVQTF